MLLRKPDRLRDGFVLADPLGPSHDQDPLLLVVRIVAKEEIKNLLNLLFP